jgi:toxin secretion/phage lysis holin
MEKENVMHGIVSIIIAGVSAYFQIIAIPLIMLTVVMLIDYITGMISAYSHKELSSRKGLAGIFKKLGYFCLVAVGITTDYIVCSALSSIGITSEVTMVFGLIITIWLIINELISILENLSKMEVPIPDFLTRLIQRLKSTVENKGNDKTGN